MIKEEVYGHKCLILIYNLIKKPMTQRYFNKLKYFLIELQFWITTEAGISEILS